MGGMFSSPKSPPPPTAAAPAFQPAPSRSAEEVTGEAVAERTRRAAQAGRQSTLLTGTSDEGAGDRKKTLLGG